MVEREIFTRYVHECLGRLHDVGYLEAHPLSGLMTGPGTPRPAGALRRAILEALEQLRPGDQPEGSALAAQWRRYRLLTLRYLEGRALTEAARELSISPRQASRDQQQAVDYLAGLLFARIGHLSTSVPGRGAEREARSGAPGGPSASPEIETELGQLTKASPEAPPRLSEIVDGVVATTADLAASRGISLETTIPDIVSPVAVDRVVLRQALFSLLGAAIEMTGNARLVISAADTARGVELTLSIRRRAGRPPAPDGRASGQMAIEALLVAGKQLVEAQGGTVAIQRHLYGNLAVILILPPARTCNVLVIDDNSDVVGLFRRYLRQTNYRLIHAGTGQGALRLASEMRPDAITLDLMMPSQDGWEILQQLRRLEATRAVPIVVCSVLPQSALAQSLGASAFLTKPVNRASLLAALEQCCLGRELAERPG